MQTDTASRLFIRCGKKPIKIYQAKFWTICLTRMGGKFVTWCCPCLFSLYCNWTVCIIKFPFQFGDWSCHHWCIWRGNTILTLLLQQKAYKVQQHLYSQNSCSLYLQNFITNISFLFPNSWIEQIQLK